MRNFTIYLALFLCLLVNKTLAQETFEAKARATAEKIESITKEEKAALKAEIEAVNKELEAGTITKEQADAKKLLLAETRSKNIETRVGQAQEELKELVNQKVEGKIKIHKLATEQRSHIRAHRATLKTEGVYPPNSHHVQT